MKKFLLSLLLGLFFVSFASATTTYIAKTENGHAYKVMKVALDGKSKIVVSAIANYAPAQSLKTLMDNVGGSSAINGGYFCPNEGAYSRCIGNTTDGLRVSNGTLYSKRGKDIGTNRSVFGFDKDGIPLLVADKGSNRPDADVDKIYNGMMMPTLVKDGVNVAVLNSEMNNDVKQGKAGNKSFICSMQDNSIIYMGTVNLITFSDLGDYLIETFDCYNAIQLDNGGSSAMINNGKYIAGPGRAIMDAFVIVEGNNVGTNLTPMDMVNETGTNNTVMIDTNEELKNAITWMYTAGLTSKSTVADFLPNNTMTREEASKFFSVFAAKEFSRTENTNASCIFSDINHADPTLAIDISNACKLGIFKGGNGKFNPKDKLNNAQAITVLMRIVVGQLQEPSNAFYTNYLLKAKEFKLVGNIGVNNNITRGGAAILLYKASIYKEDLPEIGTGNLSNGDTHTSESYTNNLSQKEQKSQYQVVYDIAYIAFMEHRDRLKSLGMTRDEAIEYLKELMDKQWHGYEEGSIPYNAWMNALILVMINY